VSVVKTFVDAITPLALLPVWSNIISTGLESAINITWLAPAIGYIIMNADNLEPSDWLGYVSNVFFDVGGAFTPATIKENWAYLGSPLMEATAQGFFESTCVASLMYGAFSLGAGIAQFTKH